MPGSAILSPSNARHGDLKAQTSGNGEPGAVPKRKKSVIGRIKKTLSTKLGRRTSISIALPTQKDLIKVEPESTEVSGERQENEDEEGEKDSSKISQNSSTDPKGSLDGDQTDAERVLQFDFPLPVTKKLIGDEDLVDDVKRGPADHEVIMHASDHVRDRSDDSDNEGEEQNASVEGEAVAAHNEVERDGNVKENSQLESASDDDDGMLEVFDNGDGNQQLSQSPCHEPENDDEEEEEEDRDVRTDDKSPFEPSPSMQNVELMVVGISLQTLAVDDSTLTFDQGESLDDAPETVVLPQPSEQPAVKCSRPTGPMLVRVPSNSPRVPFSPSIAHGIDQQPRPPLQGIREEDACEVEHPSIAPRRLAGRRHAVTASMSEDAPILSSAFNQTSQIDKQDVASSPMEASSEEEQDDCKSHQQKDGDDVDPESIDTGALITHAFGERVVSLLAADPWGERLDGFDAIKLAVKKADISINDLVTRQRLLCASLAAVQCGVEDRVAPVMFCSLECLRAVLKQFARILPDEHAFSDTDSNSAAALNNHLSSLVGALVRKLGDSNKRTQREATQALVRIARLRSLRALPHLLLHLSGREVPARRQLETLRRLMQELGLATSAELVPQQQQLTVETVLEFVAPSLKIAEEKTRRAAVELLSDLQIQTGNSTAWHAKLARAGAVKPEMLRVITRRVEELLAVREQQQQAAGISTESGGSTTTNQTEEQVDDEAAFPPAELVDVPQEDATSSIALLETALTSAQGVIGPVGWRKLSSKTWSDRKEALLDVEKAMMEAKSDLRDTRPAFGSTAQGTFVAYSAILHRALSDSIAPVVNTALDTYATLVKIFGPRIEWREADVREVTLLTLLRLLAAMQKPNTRTTRAACRGVLKLARLPNARHPLRYVLSCVFGGEDSGACDPQVQMHLLRLLVPEFGFQADGLGASRVLDAVSKGLTHNSARVRRSAADVALSAQRLLGRDFVLARLQGVKPVTLKELEKSFVDGVGGSGGGERPQTVHATVADITAPAAIGGSDLPPVTFGGLGEFSSRRLLSSAPVGIGRLQCTPLYEEMSLSPSHQGRASVLSNEEESLMESILGDGNL